MITDGDSTELVQQFAAWYQGTQPYGASTDGRRFASFTTESNGMSLQCTSAWTDAHSTNGTRYCGPSIHLDLYSTNPRHTTALLARILDVIVSHRRGHFFIVMPASCDHAGIVRRPWAQHRRCGHQARRISRHGRLSIVWKEIPVLVPPLIPARVRPPQTLSSTA